MGPFSGMYLQGRKAITPLLEMEHAALNTRGGKILLFSTEIAVHFENEIPGS